MANSALKVIIRNTFLDIDESEEGTVAKRSSSVPRAWKPRSPLTRTSFARNGSPSASTCASEASDVDASTATPRVLPTVKLWDGTLLGQEFSSPHIGFDILPCTPTVTKAVVEVAVPPLVPQLEQLEEPAPEVSSWTGKLNPDAAEFWMNPFNSEFVMPWCGPMDFMPFPMTPMNFVPDSPESCLPESCLPESCPATPYMTPQQDLLTPSRLNPKARAFEPGASFDAFDSAALVMYPGMHDALDCASEKGAAEETVEVPGGADPAHEIAGGDLVAGAE